MWSTCLDLIAGIQGDDLLKLYGELRGLAEDVIDFLKGADRPLPPPARTPFLWVAGSR